MEKCLETQLRGAVNNDTLPKLGELVIDMKLMPTEVSPRAGFVSVVNPSIESVVRILNDDNSITFTNGLRSFVIDNNLPDESRSLATTKDTKIAISNPQNIRITLITEHNHNILLGMSYLTSIDNMIFLRTYDAPSDFYFTKEIIKQFLKIPNMYGYEIRNDSYRGNLEDLVIEAFNEYIEEYSGRVFTIYLNSVTIDINGVNHQNIFHRFTFRIEGDSIYVYIDDVTMTQPQKLFMVYSNGSWTYYDIPL